jgi:lysine-specific permease
MNEKYKPDDTTTAIDITESCYSSASSTIESTTPPPNTLRRGLKARHIQMIALGGTIGNKYILST